MEGACSAPRANTAARSYCSLQRHWQGRSRRAAERTQREQRRVNDESAPTDVGRRGHPETKGEQETAVEVGKLAQAGWGGRLEKRGACCGFATHLNPPPSAATSLPWCNECDLWGLALARVAPARAASSCWQPARWIRGRPRW